MKQFDSWPCETCQHPRSAHPGAGPCRECFDSDRGAMGCAKYVGAARAVLTPEAEDQPIEGPARVCIDVPAGYALSIHLIPYVRQEGPA